MFTTEPSVGSNISENTGPSDPLALGSELHAISDVNYETQVTHLKAEPGRGLRLLTCSTFPLWPPLAGLFWLGFL